MRLLVQHIEVAILIEDVALVLIDILPNFVVLISDFLLQCFLSIETSLCHSMLSILLHLTKLVILFFLSLSSLLSHDLAVGLGSSLLLCDFLADVLLDAAWVTSSASLFGVLNSFRH